MRFYKNQKVFKLSKDLGLGHDIVEFKMGGDNNLNYLRGKRFTHAKSNDKLWFQIFNTANKGKNPYALLNSVFGKIKELNNEKGTIITPEDWQRVRLTWKVPDPTAPDPSAEVPLYKWEFEYLLRQMGLDPEAIRMIQYSLGFRSLFNRNVNAGFGFQGELAFSNPDAFPDSKFYTLKHGFDQIVKELRNKLKGTQVQLNSELISFKQDSNEFPINVSYREGHAEKKIRCKYLVLAIPRLALKKLGKYNPELGENHIFNDHIESVISQSLVKVNLYFEHQWWADLNITDGPNYTDLKLGTVYPISPFKKKKLKLGESLKNFPGSLTIYCDYESSHFWQSLQMEGTEYKPRNTTPCNCEHIHKTTVAASDILVKVAMDQLNMLFQMPNIGVGSGLPTSPKEIIPEWPIMATFTHWTEEEFGDSTHAWKVGANDRIVSPAMYNLLGDNIAIIGESYSIAQEWVEGSLLHTDGFIAQHITIK